MTSKEINQQFIEEPIKALNALFELLCEGEHTYSEHNFWLKLHQIVAEALEKLDQLEDIEEELGIDLITLFKALKDGIYFYGQKEEELQDVQLRMFHEEPMLVHNCGDLTDLEVYVAGYGKTWALTKEELE